MDCIYHNIYHKSVFIIYKMNSSPRTSSAAKEQQVVSAKATNAGCLLKPFMEYNEKEKVLLKFFAGQINETCELAELESNAEFHESAFHLYAWVLWKY